MKKMNKFLRFEDIRIQSEQQHPKDVSRAHFTLTQSDPQMTYSTTEYGIVTSTTISWKNAIELPYISQPTFNFATKCEHEYGYEMEELKALYSGIIYVESQRFFQKNIVHAFDEEGRKCAILKFVMKVVERQDKDGHSHDHNASKQVIQDKPKEQIGLNLIGKMSIYSAVMSISPNMATTFYTPKPKALYLSMHFSSNAYASTPIVPPSSMPHSFKWHFSPAVRLELTTSSPSSITFSIVQSNSANKSNHNHENNNLINLTGIMLLSVVERERRFTVQRVQMRDIYGEKLATLQVDMRYISKLQLLDLLYSPKQLAESTMQKSQREKFFSQRETEEKTQRSTSQLELQNRSKNDLSLSRQLTKLKSNSNLNSSTNSKPTDLSPSKRYKFYLMNRPQPKKVRYSQVQQLPSYKEYIRSKQKESVILPSIWQRKK